MSHKNLFGKSMIPRWCGWQRLFRFYPYSCVFTP